MENLQREILAFTKSRNWDDNHDARNLAISVSLEASELLEHFQWLSAEEAIAENKDEIAEEAADIFIYLLQFADVLGINLKEEAYKKIKKNAVRFPI